jgi:hypothetical protein
MTAEHIFKSHLPDITIPNDLSLPQFILSHAAKHGSKAAYVVGDEPNGRQVTFAQVVGLTRKVCHGLLFKYEGRVRSEDLCFGLPPKLALLCWFFLHAS